MLVTLRNRVCEALECDDLGVGEPWLILDAGKGMATGLARLWTLGLLVAPWIMTVTSLQFAAIAFGIQTQVRPSRYDCVWFLLLLSTGIVSFWITLTLVSDLLLLRRLQRSKIRDTSNCVGSA